MISPQDLRHTVICRSGQPDIIIPAPTIGQIEGQPLTWDSWENCWRVTMPNGYAAKIEAPEIEVVS